MCKSPSVIVFSSFYPLGSLCVFNPPIFLFFIPSIPGSVITRTTSYKYKDWCLFAVMHSMLSHISQDHTQASLGPVCVCKWTHLPAVTKFHKKMALTCGTDADRPDKHLVFWVEPVRLCGLGGVLRVFPVSLQLYVSTWTGHTCSCILGFLCVCVWTVCTHHCHLHKACI